MAGAHFAGVLRVVREVLVSQQSVLVAKESVRPYAGRIELHPEDFDLVGMRFLPDGTRRPLILIRNWDFNWQDQYRYAKPFWLPAGTRLEMEDVFDNSDTNPRNPSRPPTRVSWGWRSSDEMADMWIQVMTRSESDRQRLIADVRRKMAAEDAIGCEVLIAREPEYAALRNDAAALYMELGQPEQALTHFRAVEHMQPASARG